MKLTFSDSPEIDELTFKRLLLLSSELTFVDRPSIQLAENYGTLGMSSGVKSLVKDFEGSPVKLIVDEPPNSTFNSDFYRKYFGKKRTQLAILRTVPQSIIPYRYKKNKKMLLLGALISVLLLPFVLLQVVISWRLATKKLKEGSHIEPLGS